MRVRTCIDVLHLAQIAFRYAGNGTGDREHAQTPLDTQLVGDFDLFTTVRALEVALRIHRNEASATQQRELDLGLPLPADLDRCFVKEYTVGLTVSVPQGGERLDDRFLDLRLVRGRVMGIAHKDVVLQGALFALAA